MNHHAVLAHFPKITYARYKKLAAYFCDLNNLWNAEMADLISAGLDENIAYEFLTWRDQNPAEKIETRLEKEGIRAISIESEGYPKLLREINDPPYTLFVRGRLPDDEAAGIAVVGTRKMTTYGQQTCRDLCGGLAQNNIIIISGLALGIDGVAHQTALECKAPTVAVLGSGVDKQHIYPSAHKQLAEKIIFDGGAVISEYPPGFMPTQYSFPARNRIIAGLSLGVLVIEAPEDSGALITAKCALDYNREVFAVPHALTSLTGTGPNNLIKMGAKLVTGANDILEELNLLNIAAMTAPKNHSPHTPEEEKILSCLCVEPKNINVLIKESGLASAVALSTITIMEMRGKVRNLGGMNYSLAPGFKA